MNFEKRMKKRGNEKLDQYTPELYAKPRSFPLWAKLSIPLGSVAVTAAVALAIILPLNKKEVDTSSNLVVNELNQIVKPTVEKTSDTLNRTLSTTTYNSYKSFANKFVSLMMEVNNTKEEQSLGISIPDAYICLAITGVISSDAARNDILSYLELADISELRTAVKETIAVFATLFKDEYGQFSGGYNLNSIWLNPEKVHLLQEKDEELYNDLASIFDASVYLEALTSDKANQYMAENGLPDLPVPEIELNDKDPSAMNVMSAYYCLDYFTKEEQERFKGQYDSQTHKMDYKYSGQTEKVDYIERNYIGNVYEGDDFYGANLRINNLHMSYYLPNDEGAMPSDILDDILNGNYHCRETTCINYETNEEVETINHNVYISAPYFSLDNKAGLSRKDLEKILPVITNGGAGERMAASNDGYPMYLDYLKQFSVMKFNYDGFYSCSVTIVGYEAESAELVTYQDFHLDLNHPYVFEVKKTVKVGEEYSNLPIIIGEIVNPDYVD